MSLTGLVRSWLAMEGMIACGLHEDVVYVAAAVKKFSRHAR